MMRSRAALNDWVSVGSIWVPAFAGKVGFLDSDWRLETTLGGLCAPGAIDLDIRRNYRCRAENRVAGWCLLRPFAGSSQPRRHLN
ncbi:hypothetical protein CSW60_06550 [Caulobacter sp. X]|nr:hypothetical protein CSW60_06550 [Caulobacter sp. X]